MTLFDPSPYWLHPGLWPPAGPEVLSDDEAAELVWPGATRNGGVPVVDELNVPLWADESGVQ